MSEIELKACPFCGGACYWCDTMADDDGDMHHCDHIICGSCKMDFTSIGEATYSCESVDDAKRVTASAFNTRADGWISLSEKRPKVDDWVLLLDSDNTMGMSVIHHIDKIDKNGDCFENYIHNYTHWMPLPQPPTKKGD